MDHIKLKNEILPQFDRYIRDGAAVLAYYTDLLNIIALSEELSITTEGVDFFKLLDEKRFAEASNLHFKQSQIISLLKSIYLLCNIFINRLLAELTDSRKITFMKFINDGGLNNKFDFVKNIDTSKILNTYCIVVFRNKLLAHHDIYRGEGATINGLNSSIMFFGVSNGSSGFPETEKKNIIILKEKYEADNTDLKQIENYYEIAKILFYLIPIGPIGNVNPDRKMIDQIVEKSGISSFSFEKIINSIDEFIFEILNAILNISLNKT